MSKMLIDAHHPEETRVVVARGSRIEEFDFEAADKRQLKGNIYLAKVTRVEPSLQAAFVEYGGNRHGFLAFSEIHPDYYQIPHEDREALIAEERAFHNDDHDHHEEDAPEDENTVSEAGATEEAEQEQRRESRSRTKRRYKIQDVIKRRQILLVQVVKEERGGKGAALTSYLSLAGRYSVLMPNTLNGGGISRKISNGADRKRLKEIMGDMVLPQGMACIIRTAGLKRTKVEIRRDFDYLTRLWDGIRDTTLSSVAPALIYEDSSLIKRAIRDIYSREIEEIVVDGEEGYRTAKEFMKLLMPSHAKRVQLYKDRVPLFQRHMVESQLETMYHPTVQLKSGGYIVINPTEALVSIDINSGRSTKEHNIEETAVRTNLEAADEIARQLRLRDMAGLVVIDFIDMENSGNVRKVERQIKEALKVDRARIQVGRISQFGLLEMSRQRLRTGVLEASTIVCPHCKGNGYVRSVPSSTLYALRAIEEEAVKARSAELVVKLAPEVGVYVLNKKRTELHSLERRYGIRIEIELSELLVAPDMEIERIGTAPAYPIEEMPPITIIEEPDEDIPDDEEDEEEIVSSEEESSEEPREAKPRRERDGDAEGGRSRGRRRRRGGRGRDRDGDAPREPKIVVEGELPEVVAAEDGEKDGAEPAEATLTDTPKNDDDKGGRRRRRRGRRGGRQRKEGEGEIASPGEALEAEATDAVAADSEMSAPEVAHAAVIAEPVQADAEPTDEVDPDAKPKRVRKPRVTKKAAEAAAKLAAAPEAAISIPQVSQTAVAPVKIATAPAPVVAEAAVEAKAEVLPPEGVILDGNGQPIAANASRKGWWSRTFG
jgi:ribonuclease E